MITNSVVPSATPLGTSATGTPRHRCRPCVGTGTPARPARRSLGSARSDSTMNGGMMCVLFPVAVSGIASRTVPCPLMSTIVASTVTVGRPSDVRLTSSQLSAWTSPIRRPVPSTTSTATGSCPFGGGPGRPILSASQARTAARSRNTSDTVSAAGFGCFRGGVVVLSIGLDHSASWTMRGPAPP